MIRHDGRDHLGQDPAVRVDDTDGAVRGFCVGTQNEKDMLARMHMEQNAARKTKASLLKRLPA